MEFPITDLLDYASSVAWIVQHFHAGQLKCPRCRCPVTQARVFRRTRRSALTTYRCTSCGTPYNLYSSTVFQQSHLTPMQIVLFLRGICKGEPTQDLAAEIGLSYQAALRLRHALQANAQAAQPKTPLPDRQTETDEMFQNAGEKRRQTRRSRGSAAAPREQPPRARHLC